MKNKINRGCSGLINEINRGCSGLIIVDPSKGKEEMEKQYRRGMNTVTDEILFMLDVLSRGVMKGKKIKLYVDIDLKEEENND